MTWQLASFALLAAALATGFGWYERQRPPARVVALVATLAAFAALGRIAFAALPNVKPTTDIVLIAGLALGGAPGFAVGALAALSSNFFFGQGPWTPWEMLAWGGVGVGGAVLGRFTGGRIGRVPLALACAMAGAAHGAVMDFSTWVTFSGDHTLAKYLAVSGASLPFNVAHVIGNVLFCLAFGPALVRALQRFRARLEVTWRSAPTGAVAPLALLLALALAIGGGAAADARAASSAGYLLAAQNSDGGFGAARGQGSSQLHSGWAALGLAAAGHNPLDVRRGGRSVVDYIRGAGSAGDAGALERTILVLGAAGVSPRSFGGHDLVAALLRHRRRDSSFDHQVNLTAFGVLALRAAGYGTSAAPVKAAASWIAAQQNRDGGFNFAGGGGSSGIDDTSAPLQALVAADRRGSAVKRAATFLTARQNGDGGFPLSPGGPSNAQSTAWAVQGLVAAGRDPDRVRCSGHTPLGYLRSLTAPDGSVRYSRTSGQTPVWVTAQALTALARRPFPLARVARRSVARAATAAPPTAAARQMAGVGRRQFAPASRNEEAALVRAAGMAGLLAGWLLPPTR